MTGILQKRTIDNIHGSRPNDAKVPNITNQGYFLEECVVSRTDTKYLPRTMGVHSSSISIFGLVVPTFKI